MVFRLLFILLCLPVITFGQGYSIDIAVEGQEDGQALLAYHLGKSTYIKDSAQIKNGKFRFEGDTLLERGVYLIVLPPQQNYFEILVADDQQFKLSTVVSDQVGSMSVTGSENNKLFYEYMNLIERQRKTSEELKGQKEGLDPSSDEYKKIEKSLANIDREIKEYQSKLVNDHPNLFISKILMSTIEPEMPEELTGPNADRNAVFRYYRSHYFDNIDFSETGLIRAKVLLNKIETYLDRLSYQHPDSLAKSVDYLFSLAAVNDVMYKYVVIETINKYATSKQLVAENVYAHIVENYYLNGKAPWTDAETLERMGKRLKQIKPTLLSAIAPDFTIPDAKGVSKRLHEQKAQYTLLVFVNFENDTNRRFVKDLVQMASPFDSEQLTLFTVSITESNEIWLKNLQETGLSAMDNAVNTHDPLSDWWFDENYDYHTRLPRVFLLDQDKKIILKKISLENVKTYLSERVQSNGK